MIFLTQDWPWSDRIWIDTLDEEERNFAKLDSFNLDELLYIYLLVQTQLSLLVDLSERAIDRSLSLVDLTLWEVQLVCNSIPRVVIDHEK